MTGLDQIGNSIRTEGLDQIGDFIPEEGRDFDLD